MKKTTFVATVLLMTAAVSSVQAQDAAAGEVVVARAALDGVQRILVQIPR